MGLYLEQLTFSSRLDNSRKNVVNGVCTRSTNSVCSKLLQLARVALLAWFTVHCAFRKSESLSIIGVGLIQTRLQCRLLDIPP